jgi:negative regulator of sigma-B (phosphoserine phosphatase)
METVSPMVLDWGVASLPLNGQSESGDRSVVQFFPGGVLLGVIDGLGHGNEAALAASAAESILRAQPQEPVISLVRQCHENLHSTRGVVMSVVSFDILHGLMTWLGVGNVRGVLRRSGSSSNPPQEELLLRAGVIGGQIPLPPLQAAVLPVFQGDTLFLASDGIRGEFALEQAPSEMSQRTAQVILSRFANGNDDALVLVARIGGNRQ